VGKPRITVFLCDEKDCRRVWNRVCRDDSPASWLQRQLRESLKGDVVKTECMDRCEEAATICLVAGSTAAFETRIDSKHDRDRLVTAVQARAENRAT
jgi:predicted metal-binding protein